MEWKSGESLDAVERDYIRDVAPWRVGKPQPKAWGRYRRGQQTPTPPGRRNSEVDWAERQYPGTAGSYRSSLWWFLKMHFAHRDIKSVWPALVDQIDPVVLHNIDADNWMVHGYMLPQLGTGGFLAAVAEPHLDALAILLFQVQRSSAYEPPDKPLVYAALWLQRWLRDNPALKRARKIFADCLSKVVPEFSFLREDWRPDDTVTDSEYQLAQANALNEGLRKLVSTDDVQLAERISSILLEETLWNGADFDADDFLHVSDTACKRRSRQLFQRTGNFGDVSHAVPAPRSCDDTKASQVLKAIAELSKPAERWICKTIPVD